MYIGTVCLGILVPVIVFGTSFSFDWYLNLPDTPHPDENPLNYAHICELQQQDEELLALQVKNPDNYVNLQLDDDIDDIICYKKDPTQPNWKIALP
jgi:hypothetical protein